jgi:hypothetical protein
MGVKDLIVERLGGVTPDAYRSERVNNSVLNENLRRLEMAMEEEGWRRTTSVIEQEFTRGGLSDMIRISRAMYLVHPLLQHAVDVKTYYIWSQGSSTQAVDSKIQDIVVDPMMEDDANRDELFGHQGQLATSVDRQVDGNLFFGLFTNGLGDVSVRSIPVEQITEILSREGDGRITTFYRRMWTEEVLNEYTGAAETHQKEELHPDWRYHPSHKPDMFGGLKVNWDAPIIHRKTGGFKAMKYGVPETYAALEWARAYKGFLEDWHSIVKSLSRFAWKASTKGRKGKKLRKKLEEEGKGTGPNTESEPKIPRPKRMGDAIIMGEGDDFTPIPKTGATVASEDARPSRLMVAAAMGLPDTIMSGDVDVGNFATSKTLDRPTELMMLSEQQLEADLRADIFRYSIDAKVRALQLPGKEVQDPRSGLWRIEYSGDPTVNITFPPILEHDTKANIEAIVAAATLMGRTDAGVLPPEYLAESLLEALGAEDIDKLMKELPEEEQEEAENEMVDAIESLVEALKQGRNAD